MTIGNLEIRDKVLANMALYYRIRQIYLFGQILSDIAASDCDVEVLVEFFPNSQITEYDFLEFKGLLAELFNRNVDVFRAEEIGDRVRLKEIFKNGKKIYAA